jgi:hypothetical protein
MACNCRKQVNALAEKYGESSNGNEKLNPVLKVLEFLLNFIIRILSVGIIIVMIVPMLIYYVINTILGRETRFRINHKYLGYTR